MSTWKQFGMILLLLGGYIVAITALILIQFALEASKILSFKVSTQFFIIAHLLLLVVFGFTVYRAFRFPLMRQARESGLPAEADVLESSWTGWRRRRKARGIRITLGKPTPRRREYKLRLQVIPPEGTPYEATVFDYFEVSKEPTKGMRIPVKIHPQHPEIVVVADDEKPQ